MTFPEANGPEGQDEVKTFREDFDHLPGLIEAQRRMRTYDHKVFPAFDSLEIFDHHTAIEFLKAPLGAIRLPEDQRGRMAGIVLAFAITAIEADRKLREEDSVTP